MPSEPIIVSLITGLCLIIGPLVLAIYHEYMKDRARRREEKKTREDVTTQTLNTNAFALEALQNHLNEVLADRDWWRQRAMYYEKVCFRDTGLVQE